MKLFANAKVHTMGSNTRVADCLLVDGDTLAYVGEQADLPQNIARSAEPVDLKGGYVLPAYLDGHSHLCALAQSMTTASLFEAQTMEQVQDALLAFAARNHLAQPDALIGFGLDSAVFQQQRQALIDLVNRIPHPTAVVFDSGHMGILNHALMRKLGISDTAPDPIGGVYGRNGDGRLNGYMEESAFTGLSLPTPVHRDPMHLLQEAQRLYAEQGVLTVQEGCATYEQWQMLVQADQQGILQLDTVAYARIDAPAFPAEAWEYRSPQSKLRLGGYKVFLDGSPQGKTAWLTKPYQGENGYAGYPIHTDAQVYAYAERAEREGK